MTNLAIYGAGGFGREIACYIKRINDESPTWNLIGFFDDGLPKGKQLQYGPVLGGLEDLNAWPEKIAIVVSIATPKTVKYIVDRITNSLVEFPNIIDPSVTFLDLPSVRMGKGNVIGANSLLACNTFLGDFNLINWYVQMGHESCMGSFNVVMPNVNISGGVAIGDLNFFGVKSTVLQYTKIGDHVTLGAASVLLKNAENNATYYGNPARIIRKDDEKE
ncbi:MAG: serine acetyltransferase [Bacteroidales bacterium]|nr:serine acetyltransferase [Bacteroidales bacterium]